MFALNAHASYACRHAGACCTAGWTIPVEAHARGLLKVEWLTPEDGSACPEYDRESSRCRVHRDYGEAMLPRSCHHFPRRALIDDRGTFVTLSHFCPTAASALLVGTEALRVVSDPQGFPEDRDYDGLTATAEWPPLLRRDVLFDLDSFGEWERDVVTRIGGGSDDVAGLLSRVAADVERLRAWRPADGPLIEWTRHIIKGRASLGGAAERPPLRYRAYADWWSAHDRVCSFVPRELKGLVLTPGHEASERALVEPHWEGAASLVNRYVAAKAFASWTAYQWRDIRTQVAELYVAASVVRVECARAADRLQRPLDATVLHEAVRASDLLLMHLVDRDPLVSWLREAECDG